EHEFARPCNNQPHFRGARDERRRCDRGTRGIIWFVPAVSAASALNVDACHASERFKTTMPAYWLARAKITDPVAYKKYTDRVPDIINRYGGKILARGGRYRIMEGPEDFHRFVVIEFPTLE